MRHPCIQRTAFPQGARTDPEHHTGRNHGNTADKYHMDDDFDTDGTDHGTNRASHGNNTGSDTIHNGYHDGLIGIADYGFVNNNSGANQTGKAPA